MTIEEGHVVRIRHSYYLSAYWRVVRVTPSLKPGTFLYRVQLLNSDGSDREVIKPIVVNETMVRENLGRYEEWLTTKNV